MLSGQLHPIMSRGARSFSEEPSPPERAAGTAKLGNKSSGEHHYEWLGTGFSVLETMLREIGLAQDAVRLEFYIFTESEIGRRFCKALTAAAQRGAKVRLLLDAVGSFGLKQDFFSGMEA